MFDLQNPQHLRERADALEAPEGTPIEIETDSGWLLVNEPIWAAHQRYRVKPTPRPSDGIEYSRDSSHIARDIKQAEEFWRGSQLFTIEQFLALQAIASAYEQGWRPKLPDCAEARHPDYQLPPLPESHRFLKKHEYIQPGDLQWFGHGLGRGWQKVITPIVGVRYIDDGALTICRKQ